MNWISVEDELPCDYWQRQLSEWERQTPGKVWDVEGLINDYLVTVITGDPIDDPEVTIADYTKKEGFFYILDRNKKYDGNPWTVTHWMPLPKPPKQS